MVEADFSRILTERYGLDSPVTSVRRLDGGRINDTYRVDTDAGAYMMQHIRSEGERAPERLRRYAWVRAALSEAVSSILLPDIVRTTDSEPYAEYGGEWYHVQRYIPHDPLETHTEDTVRSAGELFGRLRVGLRGHTPEDEVLWPVSEGPRAEGYRRGFEEALTRHAGHPYHAEAESWRQEIADMAAYADSIALRPETGVIHADEKLANVLFREGRAFALVDIGGFARTRVAWSVGQLLRSAATAEYPRRPYAATLVRAALSGYDAVVPESERFGLAEGLGAAIRQTANLAVRFATDVLEERVFRHDASRYARPAEQSREAYQRYLALYRELRRDRTAAG